MPLNLTKLFAAFLLQVVVASLCVAVSAQETIYCTAEGDDPKMNIEDCSNVLSRPDLRLLERARAFNNRALNYMDLGDYESASEDLSRAIELVPSEPSFYLNAAYLLEQQGDKDTAHSYYQLALRHETDLDQKAFILEDIKRLKASE